MADTCELATVVLNHSEDEPEIILGEVEWGEDNQFAIVSSPTNSADFLCNLMESLNEQTSVCVKGPGEAQFSLVANLTEKSDPGFRDACREYLWNLYSIELRSSRDVLATPESYRDLN